MTQTPPQQPQQPGDPRLVPPGGNSPWAAPGPIAPWAGVGAQPPYPAPGPDAGAQPAYATPGTPYGAQPPYGAPVPYGAPPAPGPYGNPVPELPFALDRRPVRAEAYPQLLRHSLRAWWRPIVALVVMAASFFATLLLGFLGVVIVGALVHPADPGGWMTMVLDSPGDPVGFLATNLMLAALIPAAMLALWAGFGVSPRATFSVTGRFRWRWLGWLSLVVFPYFAAYLTLMWFLSGAETGARPQHWGLLVVLCLLTTPLQCAGEEYGFRVFFLQALGAWFPQRWLAVLVPCIVSVPLFAAAHGSFDVWTFADIALFALATMFVAWRTGGIEAPIVMHCANNVVLMLQAILLGGFDEIFVDSGTTGSPVSFLMSAVNMAVVVGIVLLMARWRKPERTGDPEQFRLSRRREERALAAQVRGGYLPGGPRA